MTNNFVLMDGDSIPCGAPRQIKWTYEWVQVGQPVTIIYKEQLDPAVIAVQVFLLIACVTAAWISTKQETTK